MPDAPARQRPQLDLILLARKAVRDVERLTRQLSVLAESVERLERRPDSEAS